MATLVSADIISLILRVFVGGALLMHGLPKARGGWKQSGQWVGSMGVPPVAATLVTILEFAGGIMLIVGLLVPLVALFFGVQFAAIIAMKSAKMKATFLGSGGKTSYELDFTYLLLSVAILLLGAGVYSLDFLIGIP